MFEHFVKAIFACALEGVAHEGRRPSKEDPTDTFFSIYLSPSGKVRGVNLRIDLTACFDHIERCDEGVSWTACFQISKAVSLTWDAIDDDRNMEGDFVPMIPPKVQAAKYVPE